MTSEFDLPLVIGAQSAQSCLNILDAALKILMQSSATVLLPSMKTAWKSGRI